MKKAFFYLLILFSFLAFSFFTYKVFLIGEKDIEEYHAILNRKSDLTSCKSLKREPLYQTRQNVQKDIYLTQSNNQRLHFRIFSKSSTICLIEKKYGIELLEDLKNLDCLVQDKICFNSQNNKYNQQLRYFTAKKGSYIYPSHKFTTDTINLEFFDIPGKDLPENIDLYRSYLKGFAKGVSFTLTDKSPELTAEHFRASFDLETELR